MNNQELIGKIKSANTIYVALTPFIEKKFILNLVKYELGNIKNHARNLYETLVWLQYAKEEVE
ncbi:hypothetical protein [Streptococcus australis]|uniref:hypothetical protein n=1 Tax=Streptococcus australis TaxID=113107 RepID=UPI00189E318F|nr:hypothetical protein [Streptococcus australis]